MRAIADGDVVVMHIRDKWQDKVLSLIDISHSGRKDNRALGLTAGSSGYIR